MSNLSNKSPKQCKSKYMPALRLSFCLCVMSSLSACQSATAIAEQVKRPLAPVIKPIINKVEKISKQRKSTPKKRTPPSLNEIQIRDFEEPTNIKVEEIITTDDSQFGYGNQNTSDNIIEKQKLFDNIKSSKTEAISEVISTPISTKNTTETTQETVVNTTNENLEEINRKIDTEIDNGEANNTEQNDTKNSNAKSNNAKNINTENSSQNQNNETDTSTDKPLDNNIENTDKNSKEEITVVIPFTQPPVFDQKKDLIAAARRNSKNTHKTDNNQTMPNVPAFRKLMDIGIEQLKNDQLEDAHISFTKAQRIIPQSSVVYFYLGQVALKQKKPKTAEAFARRGLNVVDSKTRREALWQVILKAGKLQGNKKTIAEAKKALQ